ESMRRRSHRRRQRGDGDHQGDRVRAPSRRRAAPVTAAGAELEHLVPEPGDLVLEFSCGRQLLRDLEPTVVHPRTLIKWTRPVPRYVSPDGAFATAAAFRRHLQRTLPRFL